jgi:hypothetical protein
VPELAAEVLTELRYDVKPPPDGHPSDYVEMLHRR